MCYTRNKVLTGYIVILTKTEHDMHRLVLALLPLIVGAEECTDEYTACQDWAQSGECVANPDFMKPGCPKSCNTCPEPIDPELTKLGPYRVKLEIEGYGEILIGFYPKAAPLTVKHLLRLFALGCYDTNHIFRVDKGFVAQVQSVHAGALLKPASEQCLREGKKNVPAEFTPIPHRRGTLSLGRMADPNSGGSSFSMLLGRAAHLDNQYTVFGEVLEGDGVLAALETVETTREGIFVMPKHRVTITKATTHIFMADPDAPTADAPTADAPAADAPTKQSQSQFESRDDL
jgi:cyclophilin family peptidyl-prolyl cis-trans isomerase